MTERPCSLAGGKRLFYFADPMCSWCWGFAPVIGAIEADLGGRVPLRVVVGGLRAGETRPMDDRAKEYVREHWRRVAETTGQPFDFAFFAREGFVYDTEPACRAVVAVRNLVPEASLGYLEAVQHAFYVKGRDVTDAQVLADLAGPFGITPEVFAAVFAAAEIAAATAADFALAQAAGISGFPAIVLADDAGALLLTLGYRPYPALKPDLSRWLHG